MTQLTLGPRAHLIGTLGVLGPPDPITYGSLYGPADPGYDLLQAPPS